MKDNKLNVAAIRQFANNALGKVNRFGFLLFVVFIAVLYGFVLMQTNNLSSKEPTSLDVQNQINAAQLPHINQTVVNQLQSLQDNSVNVQTLFNDARNNPFQE